MEINHPLSLNDAKLLIKKSSYEYWITTRQASLNSTHQGQTKYTAGESSWVLFKERNIDTSIARLRINHSRLNYTMNRLKLAQSPYYEHFLIVLKTVHISC